MSPANPFRFHPRFEDNRDVYASGCPDVRLGMQAKVQTKILSRVKSAKGDINKLFKMTGRVPPATSSLDPFTAPRVHPSPSPIPTSQCPGVCNVTVACALPSGQTRSVATTSLMTDNEYTVEEHIDDFVSTSLCAIKAPSLSPWTQLLTLPTCQRALPSALLDELSTIEEEVGDPEPAACDAHTESKPPSTSSSRGPLATSDSEAEYDAMLAAEFATFSFDSKDIREWSDEVERERQADMDAHFAYASEALAVPVPKLSAYFAADSPVKDESVSNPSPGKTEVSEATTSSADSSLMTNDDTEEDRPQRSPVILCGLRRVRNYQDLKVVMNCNDSLSDLSCWSLEMDPLNSTAAGSKTGVLRRSMKCNDLRARYVWSLNGCP